MYTKAQAPLSIGGVLDQGFKFYRAALPMVFLVSAGAAFISGLPNVLFLDSFMADPANASMGGLGISLLVVMLVSLVAFIATIKKMQALADGVDMSWGEAFAASPGRLLPIIGVAILYSLAVAGGTLLLLVPGVIVSVTLIFGNFLAVREGAGVIESLKRSHNLVWGNWWRTAVTMTVLFFVLMAIYMIVAVIAGFGAFMDPEAIASSANWIDLILLPLLSGVLTPAGYAFLLVILHDLELRKEGSDLEGRIDAAVT